MSEYILIVKEYFNINGLTSQQNQEVANFNGVLNAFCVGGSKGENPFHPIQVYHTSPLGIPRQKKWPAHFFNIFHQKIGQIIWEHMSEVLGVGAF